MQSEYPDIGGNGEPMEENLNPDFISKDFQGQVTSELRKTEGLVRNSVKGWRREERRYSHGELTF